MFKVKYTLSNSFLIQRFHYYDSARGNVCLYTYSI